MPALRQHRRPQVVVAGHICLDLIPSFENRGGDLASYLIPGKLNDVGAAVVATGGAVSNTGQSLHRLGVPTLLMGKTGDDPFGQVIRELLRDLDPSLATGMITDRRAHTSYTVVINPPQTDRLFFHCPGANDTFGAADIDYDQLRSARLFHFGYPPLMKRMYADGGVELEKIFRRVKRLGLITSLDMARPDPASPAGRVDWRALLKRVLPHVDLFHPSLDELLFMLRRRQAEQVTGALLDGVADEVLAMGPSVVAIKLGDQGLYLRTREGRHLLAPCFRAKVVGTTGAGDATIAGFLAAWLRGGPLEQILIAAVAVGACSTERADATSGVPRWSVIEKRIKQGWKRLPVAIPLPDWRWDARAGVWRGPRDQSGGK